MRNKNKNEHRTRGKKTLRSVVKLSRLSVIKCLWNMLSFYSLINFLSLSHTSALMAESVPNTHTGEMTIWQHTLSVALEENQAH